MGVVILGVFVAVGFVAAVVFGFRWTRPPSNDTMRRADDAQSGGTLDPKTIRERISSYVTIYGPKR